MSVPRADSLVAEAKAEQDTPELGSVPPEAGPSLKRKLSPSTSAAASRSPAPLLPLTTSDDPSVAPLPPLIPAPSSTTLSSEHEFWTTRSHPVNARGYRYLPCGPSPTCPPNVPFQRFIESVPQAVRFSWEDRSPFAFLTKDARTVTAEKGWRAARANVCLREGNWYWEVNIVRAGGQGRTNLHDGSWVRTGISRREGALNAPLGFDGYSYAYRDRRGDAVTLSRAQAYGQPYSSGDVVGVYLSLPPRRPVPPDDPSDPSRIVRKRIPIRYRGQLFFESLEYPVSDEMETLRADPADQVKENVIEEKAAPGQKVKNDADAGPPARPLPRLPGARLAFFLNGVCQGVSHEDLLDFVPLRRHADKKWRKKNPDAHVAAMENWHDDGTMGYYPSVSCFGGGIATLNPGPEFAFPPPSSPVELERVLRESPRPPEGETHDFNREPWRPLCERYAESIAEQNVLDAIDEAEARRAYEANVAILEEQQREREREQVAKRQAHRHAFSTGRPSPLLHEQQQQYDHDRGSDAVVSTSIDAQPGSDIDATRVGLDTLAREDVKPEPGPTLSQVTVPTNETIEDRAIAGATQGMVPKPKPLLFGGDQVASLPNRQFFSTILDGPSGPQSQPQPRPAPGTVDGMSMDVDVESVNVKSEPV